MEIDGSRVIAGYERLGARWTDTGAPIAAHLAPGLTAAAVTTAERAAGLLLPAELALWWRWHDGVRRRQPGTRLGVESRIGVGGWEFLSLAEALAERESMLRVCGRDQHPYPADDADWDGYWRPGWLPVVAFDANLLFVDCDPARRGGASAVRGWDREPTDVATARAGSWPEVVAVWERLLRERYYVWSARDGNWLDRWDDLPPEVRVSGLT